MLVISPLILKDAFDSPTSWNFNDRTGSAERQLGIDCVSLIQQRGVSRIYHQNSKPVFLL